jgi:type VI protein secretion system component Hcp
MGLHGDDVHAIYRRITLTDALITKVTRFDAPVNTNHNEHVAVQEEDVTLTFRGISIENLISSPTTLDNVTTNH